ncbi:MAG: dihydrolipoyl dehydrogenase [Candidatus Neomarinimicrobiota bacterium]
MEKFEVAVLGGGPGGYVAAVKAAQLGKNTVIIDGERLGGICLNWGCIPTKALLKNAEVLHLIKKSSRFGINIPDYEVDFAKIIKRSRDVSLRLSKGVDFLMKKNKIVHLSGRGKLVSRTTVEVDDGKKTITVKAQKIIIATGGHPRVFPGLELDGKQVISSKEAMILKQPPKRMIIIGGGAIGVEFAYFYNEFGTEVQLLEKLPHILPLEDEDISWEVEKSFKKSGIKIQGGTNVIKLEKHRTEVKVFAEKDGRQEVLIGDIVLVATGIKGNIGNIGLEKVGVKTKQDAIVINEYNQTSVDNIYAIGDVTGPPWLAHVASAQGHVAVEHAVTGTARPIDYSNIPACTYCNPQVASIGLTEARARAEGYDVKVGRFDFRASGKAMAGGDTTGFVKIIFDGEYGELLGCHIVGSEATELIAELGVAKTLETTWQELALTVHAHPTLSEAIMEAALDAFGRSVHK